MSDFAPDAHGWYKVDGDLTASAARGLRAVGSIDRLSFSNTRLITVPQAKRLRTLHSVRWLWLWCDVTRAAMRHVMEVPGLETLDVLNMVRPGELAGFEAASSLRVVRANHYLEEQDVLAIAKCATLRELGAQNADLTPKVLDALLTLPDLRVLDIEGTRFDDDMARRVAASTVLDHLDIGATRITRTGLIYLSSMKQLRALDLWATNLVEADFELLRDFPKLEYVSIGNYEGGPRMDADILVPLLLTLPSLRRVWLDGVHVSNAQKASLDARLESVRITTP